MKNKIQSLSAYLFVVLVFFIAIQLVLMLLNLDLGVLAPVETDLTIMTQ